jgi:HD domain
MAPTTPSTRLLAGVEVPDTPLISAALDFVRERSPEVLYHHCVRGWLFGCIIASKVPRFASIDREVHAIAVLFHDIGLIEGDDPKAAGIISQDKRFEVDGANAARDFLRREAEADQWDQHRQQLVWDTIALHSTVSISLHKEVEVQAAIAGIFTDITRHFLEFAGLVSDAEWDAICKEYPRLNSMKEAATELLCNVCRKKPETTYDNFLRDYGEKHVEGYNATGKKVIDILENMYLS